MPTPIPVAYSYVRFSTMKQRKGDSLRRQLALGRRWARKAGVQMDYSLKPDEGISAWKGDNVDEGALGEFLRLAQEGIHVKAGSYLVVEALDRITREKPVPAIHLLLSILSAGIRIVTLLPDPVVYDDQSDMLAIMSMVMEVSRGNNESETKSDRIGKKKARQRRLARSKLKPIKGKCPAWLTLVRGKWCVDIDRAEIVWDMYRMTADGLGCPAIADRLTADGRPNWGSEKPWNLQTVYAVLRSGNAEGVYQPRSAGRKADGPPVEGYFPRVIDAALAADARQAMSERRRRPGRVGETVNVFSGLLTDPTCGGCPVVLVKMKGKGKSWHTIGADPVKKGRVGRVTVQYLPFERAILSRLEELPREVTESAAVADSVEAARAALAVLKEKQERLAKALAADPNDMLVSASRQLAQELIEARKRVSEAQDRQAAPRADALDRAKEVIRQLDTTDKPREARLRLRALLRRVIEGGSFVAVRK